MGIGSYATLRVHATGSVRLADAPLEATGLLTKPPGAAPNHSIPGLASELQNQTLARTSSVRMRTLVQGKAITSVRSSDSEGLAPMRGLTCRPGLDETHCPPCEQDLSRTEPRGTLARVLGTISRPRRCYICSAGTAGQATGQGMDCSPGYALRDSCSIPGRTCGDSCSIPGRKFAGPFSPAGGVGPVLCKPEDAGMLSVFTPGPKADSPSLRPIGWQAPKGPLLQTPEGPRRHNEA